MGKPLLINDSHTMCLTASKTKITIRKIWTMVTNPKVKMKKKLAFQKSISLFNSQFHFTSHLHSKEACDVKSYKAAFSFNQVERFAQLVQLFESNQHVDKTDNTKDKHHKVSECPIFQLFMLAMKILLKSNCSKRRCNKQ